MYHYLKKNNRKDLSCTCSQEREFENDVLNTGITRTNKLVSGSTGAGFTLIELLVGMGIMVIATTMILSIIVSASRISSKNVIADTARQNGNYATARIIKMIQFADSFNGGSTGTNQNAGVNGTLDTSCNGNNYKAINITYDGKEKVMQCRTQGGTSSIYLVDVGPPRTDEELLNTNKITVNNCNFVCKRVIPTASPVISFSFDLSIGGTNSVVERKTSIPFRTSVKMRNE